MIDFLNSYPFLKGVLIIFVICWALMPLTVMGHEFQLSGEGLYDFLLLTSSAAWLCLFCYLFYQCTMGLGSKVVL